MLLVTCAGMATGLVTAISILGPIATVIGLVMKHRADRRSAAQERRRARPSLVFVRSSSEADKITFTLRNAGEPITKLRLDAPSATVRPSEHLGHDEECSIAFSKKPALPFNVRIEYVDRLGNADAVSIELRFNSSAVLSYGSDPAAPTTSGSNSSSSR